MLISLIQISFVQDVKLSDNEIIMPEVLYSMKSPKGNIGIKIAFKKVCYRLKWSFIRGSLLDMQLPNDLIKVIMNYVTLCAMSIL